MSAEMRSEFFSGHESGCYRRVRSEPRAIGELFNGVPCFAPTSSRKESLLSCPDCRSENVRRSYLRFYDWPMILLFIPIRCRDCHARFYRLLFG